jgi:hypothetical protein
MRWAEQIARIEGQKLLVGKLEENIQCGDLGVDGR